MCFRKFWIKHFSYFFNKGVQFLILFFMHFGQFPTFDVQKVPLLLDAFTVGSDMQVIIFQRGESPRKCGVQNLLCPLHRPNPALWKEYPCPSIFFHWVWPRVSLHNRTSSCGYSRHRFTWFKEFNWQGIVYWPSPLMGKTERLWWIMIWFFILFQFRRHA